LIEGYFSLHETLGMSPRTIQRIIKAVANRAQISRKVSPHVLRHTFAVTAIQKGISLPALQVAPRPIRRAVTAHCPKQPDPTSEVLTRQYVDLELNA